MTIADMGYRGIIRLLRRFSHFCTPELVACLIDGVKRNLIQREIAGAHELATVSVKEVLLWAAKWYEMRRIFLVFLRESTKPKAGHAISRAELQRAFGIWGKGRSVDFSRREFDEWLKGPLANGQLKGRVLLSPTQWKRPASGVSLSGLPTHGPWPRQDPQSVEPLFTDLEYDFIKKVTSHCLSKLDHPNDKEIATDPSVLDQSPRPGTFERSGNGRMARGDWSHAPKQAGRETPELGNFTRGIFDNPDNALVTDLVKVQDWPPKDAFAEVERQGYSPSWRSAEEVNRGVDEIEKRNGNKKILGDVLVLIEVWWQKSSVEGAIELVRKSGFQTSSRNTHFRWFEKTMPGFLRGNPSPVPGD